MYWTKSEGGYYALLIAKYTCRHFHRLTTVYQIILHEISKEFEKQYFMSVFGVEISRECVKLIGKQWRLRNENPPCYKFFL